MVHNYNDDLWFKSGKASTVMKKINMAKFQQHTELLAFLKNTAPIIAEANPHDKRWGISLDIKDKKFYNKDLWQGNNLLGNILVQVN